MMRIGSLLPRIAPLPLQSQPQTPAKAVAAAPRDFGRPLPGPEGAYYRKVLSSPSRSLAGIATTGVLPTPTFDPTRLRPDGSPMDVPDVYVGAHSAAGGEIDCGLEWDQIDDGRGAKAMTDLAQGFDGGDLSHRFFPTGKGNYVDGYGRAVPSGDKRLARLVPDCAYHPYWRTDFKGANKAGNRAPNDTSLMYLQPGQQFTMRLDVGNDGAAKLSVKSPGARDFAVPFAAPGFAGSSRSFKRCIAIDQFHNEKKPAKPTTATLRGGGFTSVMLVDRDGTRTALTPGKGTLTAGSSQLKRYGDIFKVSGSNPAGGEWVSITP